MAINVYSNTKIYVVASANVATGGPELLHQLVYNLRKYLNINAYMYYTPQTILIQCILLTKNIIIHTCEKLKIKKKIY